MTVLPYFFQPMEQKRYKPRITVTLDTDMIDNLNDESKRRRTSVSALVREALLPMMRADTAGNGNVQQNDATPLRKVAESKDRYRRQQP